MPNEVHDIVPDPPEAWGRAPGGRGRRGERQRCGGRADDAASPPRANTPRAQEAPLDGVDEAMAPPIHVQPTEPILEEPNPSGCYVPTPRSQSSQETVILTHDGVGPHPGTMAQWFV
ncbi:hypothetical protein PIB30_104610, partial [Stylosanthes scabra]|nr:hypothetical protein [Stylosanthes scabra]